MVLINTWISISNDSGKRKKKKNKNQDKGREGVENFQVIAAREGE